MPKEATLELTYAELCLLTAILYDEPDLVNNFADGYDIPDSAVRMLKDKLRTAKETL